MVISLKHYYNDGRSHASIHVDCEGPAQDPVMVVMYAVWYGQNILPLLESIEATGESSFFANIILPKAREAYAEELAKQRE